MLVGPAPAPDRLADVPVGGVEDLHADGEPGERVVGAGDGSAPDAVAGRRRAARAVDARSAGLGGPGRPGRERELDHQRHRQLGLGHEHRAGLDDAWPAGAGPAGRKPYSPRAASAGSSRPTTRIAELATMRRSTSLAVCWAPTRMMPSERPRSAMSSRISLIGLEPSRGVLVELVEHHEQQRPGLAGRLLALEACRSTTPTTNRLARSLRLWRSTTVTWARRSRPGGARAGARRPGPAGAGGGGRRAAGG